jgi:telomerase reverse transcriptase
VKRIKVRVLLEKSCPLIPVEAAEAAIEIPKPDLPLMSPNLFTQRPNRGRVSNPNDSTFLINPEDIDFSSTEQGPRFDPRKFHSDHPLLMSSGVGVGHLFTHATVSASDHSKSDQGSILTQMSAVQNSSNSDPSIGRETIPRLQCRADSGEMFDINNNEDYLLTLLMEPERDPFEGWNLQELVSHSCSPLQVASFIISCVNQLIPRSFLGSDENWRLLEAKIKHFIRLNRFDVLSSKQLLEGFHITDIYWCYGDKQTYGIIPRKTATDTQKATVLFHKFLVWLFEHLIMVLLRSNFYVTETMAFRNRLFYYRNEVWRSIRKQGFESLVSKGLLVPISDLEAKEILKRRELGACSLRFVPKATGLRPIVNLKKKFSNPEKTDFASSINELLAPVHAIVTHEATKNPSKILASSCMRHDEVHTRLSQFRNSVRSLFKSTPSSSHTSQDDLPPLFFVKLDIISAFDEIQQSKLMNILRQDVLIMERYISSLSSKLRVNRGRWTQSGIKTFVGPHEKVEMSEMLSGHLSKFSNSILATTATSEFATRDKLLSLLEEHITQHLIQSEGRYYLQKQGIPQGSILSSLLCSVYFGCLEKTYLSEYLETSVDQTTGKAKDASILLRWVDDFLYITTDRMKAVRFFERMHAGFDDFGTRCNPAKSSVNFPLSFRGEQVLNISFNTSNVQSTQFAGEIGEEDEEVWASANEMIWCGWLFDTRTLHIRKSIPTRIVVPEMVTTILSNRPGHSMSEKCHASVANAIHLILFDGTFNTRQVILENVFDIFAWTCLRMIAIERNMHFSTSLLPNGDPNLPALPNPKFITDLLFSLAQKFSSTLWKRISSPKAAQVKFNTKISPKDISALSLYAARAILLDHGFIRFRKVIDTLEAMINTKERENQSEQQNEEFSLVVAHRAPLFASAIF